MTINGFVAYVKQIWKNKPDTSTPLSAARLTHMEDGIKGNSDAIEKLAAAVVSQIANDPNKIASMAALYSVNQIVTQLYSDITSKADRSDLSTSTGWTKEFTFKASSVSGSIYQIAVSGTTIGLLIGHVSGGNVTLNWAYKNNENVTVQVAGLNIKLSSTSDFVAAVTTLRK